MSDDGINVRCTAWMTLKVPRSARIDFSYLSDEEFDTMCREAVGADLADRLQSAAAKTPGTYRIARVDHSKDGEL